MEACRTLIIIFILGLLANTECSVTCRDEIGDAVDWFYLYKNVGRYGPSGIPQVHYRLGERYLYMTSKTYQEGWKISDADVNDTTTLLGRTLIPIFKNESTMLLSYKDIPSSVQSKGVIAADSDTGFWLSHSLPTFPEIPEFSYPKTRDVRQNGQLFLCITFNATQLNTLGQHLKIIKPNMHYVRFSEPQKQHFPKLLSLTQSEALEEDVPGTQDIGLESLNGTKFRLLSKGWEFNKDLYDDLLAPSLESTIYVQSYRANDPSIPRDRRGLPSNCNRTFRSMNIDEYELPVYEDRYPTFVDNSKWAVSESNDDWICVGDTDRVETQFHTAGGAVCHKNFQVAKAFRDGIKALEECT